MNSFMEHEKEIASLLSVSESRGGAHRSLYLSSALRLVCAKHRGSPHTKKAPVRGAFFVIKGGGVAPSKSELNSSSDSVIVTAFVPSL